MQINIAVIDLSFRSRHRLPKASVALRRLDAMTRSNSDRVQMCGPATGRIACTWRRIAADEPDQSLPRQIGPSSKRRLTLGAVPLAA